MMCKTAGVSRSGFYAWLSRPRTQRSLEDHVLGSQVRRTARKVYRSMEQVRADVFDCIEVFYNQSRRHSHLGGIGPKAFERTAARDQDLSSRPEQSSLGRDENAAANRF